MLREQVLKVWKDLKENVLSWKEVWEENDIEQGRLISGMRRNREETKKSLTEIKTELEEAEKFTNRVKDYSDYLTAKNLAGGANNIVNKVIRDIVFLLPDRDNPYLKDICNGCCLSKSSCECSNPRPDTTVYHCLDCGSLDRSCGHTNIEEID